jgi:hypothetical protein
MGVNRLIRATMFNLRARYYLKNSVKCWKNVENSGEFAVLFSLWLRSVSTKFFVRSYKQWKFDGIIHLL